MKRCLKLLSFGFIMVAFLINSSTSYMAYDTLSASVEAPLEVEQGKGFTVGLQAKCNSTVSVVMFTVVHSDNIEYKECKVNDNDSGYIEEMYSDNGLSVIYVNTAGIVANKPTNLVDITFKADTAPSTAYIQIYTSNGVSSDEKPLVSENGKEYSINIVEKVTAKQSASERKLENSSDLEADSNENSSAESSAINKKIPDTKTDLHDIPVAEEIRVVSSIDVSEAGNVKFFIAGTIFAVAVIAVIGISYKTGKKNAGKHIRKNK